jgi:hypothetical protein
MYIILILFLSVQCKGQIINEISPYPLVGIPEWVELHNNTVKTIQLYGVTIEDNSTKQVIQDIEIPSNGYIILTKDTNALKSALSVGYEYSFIQTPLPVLNNTKDKLLIIANNGTFKDSISYAFQKIHRGKSLEREISNKCDTLLISTNPKGHTCGFTNSCLPMTNDARIIDIYHHEEDILILLENNGDRTLNNLKISVQTDLKPVIFTIDTLKPYEKDSIIADKYALSLKHGINTISAYLQHNIQDPRPYNDSMSKIVYRSYPYGTLRINEINIRNTYYPEYIELVISDSLYNDKTPFQLIINKDTFCINDSIMKEYNVISSQSLNIDDSLALFIHEPRLKINDQAGDILIRDRNGKLLDSINYGSFITEYSLYPECSFEYILNVKKQWFISTDKSGGTPGKKNSPINKPQYSKLQISPYCQDRKFDCFTFAIKHPFYIGSYSCDVFNTSGLYIKNIIKEYLQPSEGLIEVPKDEELTDQILILLHTVKDLHGTSILHVLTPFFMRN